MVIVHDRMNFMAIIDNYSAFILESGKIKHYWIDGSIGFRSCRRFYGMADTAAFRQKHYYDIG